MKKFIAALALGTMIFACTTAKNKPTKELEGYTYYGEEAIPVDDAVSMADFATSFSDGATSAHTIKTNLSSICAKAGCFVIVTMPDESEMRVMFKDHFTIPPKTEIGTEAIFTGEAKMDTTSIKDLQHYIEDEMEGEEVSEDKKAELQAKWDAVTEPEIEPVFIATGILVKN